MQSINLELDYEDHPRTKRLIGLLGKGAEMLPIRLWLYCGRYLSDSGEFTGFSAQEIESIARWWGKSGEMVEAMQKAVDEKGVSFLEKTENGWRIPNWLKNNGHLSAFKERGRAAAKARWDRYRAENAARYAVSNACSIDKQCSKPDCTRCKTLKPKPPAREGAPSGENNAPANSTNTPSVPVLCGTEQPSAPPNTDGNKQRGRKTDNETEKVLEPEEVQIPLDLLHCASEIMLWLKYKKGRREGYKPTGIGSLWAYLRGIPEMDRAYSIHKAIAGKYQGIHPAKQGGFTNASSERVVGAAGYQPGKYSG